MHVLDPQLMTPALLDAIDSLLWQAYAAGRQDELDDMASEYQREQLASANSGTNELNGEH